MSGLILCSKKSDVPYRIVDADIDIYSIEEFAYYLFNNAYFVDENFFDEDLVTYIEKELMLPKVAQKLKYAIMQKQSFIELVLIIVNSSMYYSEDEVKKFEKGLKVIGSKSVLERMKARAEMLIENGKLGNAKKVLKAILSNNMYKKPEKEFYGEVYKNLGIIDCRMFYFDDGIEHYKMAYEILQRDELLRDIVAAKLMKAYANGEPADLKEELELNEELVCSIKEEFENDIKEVKESEGFLKVSNSFLYDGRHNLDDYYENIIQVLDQWKNDYRNDMA